MKILMKDRSKVMFTLSLCICLSLMSGGTANATYYPNGIQENVSEQTLTNNGWTLFLEETYATFIPDGNRLKPSEGYVIFTGKRVNSNILSVLAAAPTEQVFVETPLNTPTLINGSYWYFTPGSSIGFAPNSNVSQNFADVNDCLLSPTRDCTDSTRLSWHLLNSDGGWRLGTEIWLNTSTDFVRQVWMWNGVRGTEPLKQEKKEEETPKRRTTNLTFGESLYGSDTLSDPTGELREMVDLINRDVTPATISMTYSSLLK